MAALSPDQIKKLPVFDRFPYLVVRVAGAMRHITLLPENASESTLAGIARAQRRANLLDVCLVMGPERGSRWDAEPPRGGALMTGRLKPPMTWPDTPHLRARRGRLNVRLLREGYSLGDLTKGGHAASADEVARLAGAGPEGVPRGLEYCLTCGEWRGTCLDPSPRFAGQVMTVHCRCANDNRCAACGRLLYERKLNANYYNPRDRGIWHVPGFCGLGHRCAGALSSPLTLPSPPRRRRG